jgi:hypothetical protein
MDLDDAVLLNCDLVLFLWSTPYISSFTDRLAQSKEGVSPKISAMTLGTGDLFTGSNHRRIAIPILDKFVNHPAWHGRYILVWSLLLQPVLYKTSLFITCIRYTLKAHEYGVRI